MSLPDRSDPTADFPEAATEAATPDQRQRAADQSLRPESVEASPSIPGYTLQRPLGAGTFGQVWAGVQDRTGLEVAVKLFARESGIDWLYFRHEVDRLRRVSEHPYVVTLLDADLTHDPPYFVMPLLPDSLAHRCRSQGRPERERAAAWIEQMTQALHYTHGKGLLHCDLKPNNIMVDQEGRVRVADFGQSLSRGTSGETTLGTLGTMAPEQAQLINEGLPDVSWDIYGLGATAYWLLSGELPRLSRQDLSQLQAIPDPVQRLAAYREKLTTTPLTPLRQLNKSLDQDLADIVERCLESEPARRTPSTADILEDFRRRRRHQPLVCRQPWSLGYRSVRFLRRNVVAVSLACALLVGLAWSFAMVVSSRNQAVTANHRSQDLLAQLEYDQGLALADGDQSQTAALWFARAAGRQPGDPRYLLILKNWPVRLTEFRDLGEMMDNDIEQHGRYQVIWRRNLDLSVLEAGNRPLGPPIKYPIDAGPVLALSPDGSRLAAGRRGSIAEPAEFSLFDVAGGRDIVRGEKMLRGVDWLAFSSDSRRLLRVADEQLDLLDAGSARPLLSRKTTSPVAAVSSDGSLVAFSNGPRVVLAGPGKSDLELDLRDPVTLCFAGADRVLVSVSRQGMVEFFDSATGRAATTHLQSGHAAVTAQLSPDGRWMAVVGESQVSFFDLQQGARLGTFPCAIAPSAPTISCSFSPDSSLVAVMHPRPSGSAEIQSSVQIYRLSPIAVERLGEPISLFEPLDDLGFSETNESLLVSIGDGIKTYDISRLLHNRPALSLNGIQISSNYPRLIDNRLAITQEHGQVTVTELATDRVLTGWKTESLLRLCLVSPDAQTLLPLYAESAVVQPVSASTGKPVGRPVTVPQMITGVAFASDGQSYATCSQDGSVSLWSLAGERLGEPLQHPYPVEEVHFDPTGRYVVAVGSGFNGLRLWDLTSRKELLSSTATLAAFSDVHPWLATGTTRLDRQGARPTIKTLRLPDLSPVGAPIISLSPQNALSFRPKSSDLLISQFGVGVRLWSPLEARPVGRTLGLEWLYWSAFDARGAWLATATMDSRTARLWDLVSGRPLTRPDQFLAASETGTHYRVPAFTPERDRLLVRVASSGRMPARLDVWDLTVDGDLPAEVLRLQAESWTGLRLDEQGGLELLNEAQWRQTTEHLQALLREHQAVCRYPRAAERP